MLAHVAGRSDIRFGLYLRPSRAMSRAQVEIHDLVARQYGSMTAGRYMPHATIKGFYRSDASVAQMVASLDPVLGVLSPFEVVNGGAISFGGKGTVVVDIHHDKEGNPNPAMQRLHRDVIDALLPLVHPDCDFTPHEPLAEAFHAHLTLMMGDIPRGLGPEILAFLQDAGPIGPPAFSAERCHLVALRSETWNDRWWTTMQWTLLHSWKLGGESLTVTDPSWNTTN